jgi:hypothetical protein
MVMARGTGIRFAYLMAKEGEALVQGRCVPLDRLVLSEGLFREKTDCPDMWFRNPNDAVQ